MEADVLAVAVVILVLLVVMTIAVRPDLRQELLDWWRHR